MFINKIIFVLKSLPQCNEIAAPLLIFKCGFLVAKANYKDNFSYNNTVFKVKAKE